MTAMVRAKFRCMSVTSNSGGATGGGHEKGSENVTLSPVYGKDGSANSQWSRWTPSGALSLSISNPEAWGKLEVGKCYFVDLAEAPEDG